MMTGSVQKSKFRETSEKERSGHRGPERVGGGRSGPKSGALWPQCADSCTAILVNRLKTTDCAP